MPPPQIKQDLNRSGWETTDFPSICENCLPENPYVKMLKEDYGAECKLCTRPFTIFSWSADRAQGRKRRCNVCLTCARLKNCCQSCMLDLSFGLPLVVRDAALKMVAPGPTSDVNREYFAQNNERAIEEGRGGVEEYEKTDEKARELLRRLATSKPYFRKGPTVDDTGAVVSSHGNPMVGAGRGGPGPIRTRDSRAARPVSGAGHPNRSRQAAAGSTHAPIGPKDWIPPEDKNIMSLFLTGVEDDLPEYKIRDFFKVHGKIKSLICSHMSHCAFVNFETREAAEKAALACQGRAIIAGCPLRVRWRMPTAVGNMNRDQRVQMLADARRTITAGRAKGNRQNHATSTENSSDPGVEPVSHHPTIAPPGSGEIPKYASLDGS
ncbi:hypothetical protein jhhlp_000582 [Lomentospora prolificans]|uniref:RRM domain-containing protein n=1 Tax=Lomentospora prolificans TaxID=41688 RepID=A0A2N3NIX5_9PEZI|nr:hypothetical protein jhhlp_000582 [Lomentospora prolificans]